MLSKSRGNDNGDVWLNLCPTTQSDQLLPKLTFGKLLNVTEFNHTRVSSAYGRQNPSWTSPGEINSSHSIIEELGLDGIVGW